MFEIFRKYILQLFIGVIFYNDKIIIRSITYKNNKTINTYERTFEEKDKALLYIKSLSKNFQIYYIGVVLNSIEQGLIPTLNESDMNNFNLDHTSFKIMPLRNSQIYINDEEFKKILEFFDGYSGIDFAYSPISILYYYIQKEFKNNQKTTCYVYKDEYCICILICKNDDILFGNFMQIKTKKDELTYEEDLNSENTINDFEENFDKQEKDTQNNEDLTNLDSNEDIKLEDIDDKTLEDQFNLSNKNDTKKEDNKANLDDFNDDMNMCREIFAKIEEFYNNSNYNSNFIEELVVLSNTYYKEDFIVDYIEGEIFLKPKIFQVDTLNLIIELMRKELDNEL